MSSPTADRLRVGLLQCGYVRDDVAADHGDYPELFAALLADRPIELVAFDVQKGPLPSSPNDCDGWLVSGSANSTYEDLPWIQDTARFITEVIDAEVALIGICFGHQLMAQALGGTVERSERGWGVGVHTYEVTAPLPHWPTDLAPVTSLTMVASHQDQVSVLPDGAAVLASSKHCPVAAFEVNDKTVAVQGHPEFTAPLSRALIEVRRAVIGTEAVEAGLASLDRPLDDSLVSSWFSSLLAS